MSLTNSRALALRELEQIGLSSYEARAYVALLAVQPVNGYDLARLSGIPTSKIYETLQRLVTKGAALASASEPTLYRAVAPVDLIGSIRSATERSLTVLAETLPDLEVAPSPGIVWRLKGYQTIVRHLQQLVAVAEHVVYLSVWPPETVYLLDAVVQARQRGVRLWVASFGPGQLDGEDVYDLLSCGNSSQARLGKRLTAAVADDRQVLIAEFQDDGEGTGTAADDTALALAAREYIVHDLVNHALIQEIGEARFAALRSQHPLLAAVLGPSEMPANRPFDRQEDSS